MVACSRIVSRRHPRVVAGVAPTSAAAVGKPHEKRRTPTSSNCSNHTIAFHADSITHRSDDDAVAIAGYRNSYPISFTSTSTTTTSSVHNKTSRSSSSSSSSTIASSSSTTLAIDEPSSLYLHNANLIAPFAIRNFSALLDSSKFEKQQELLLVEIFNILQEIVPYYLSFWNIEHPNQLVVRTLQGGLSNYLLTVQPRTAAAKELTLNYNAHNQNLEGVSSKAIIPSTILIRIHEDENASSSSCCCSTPQKYHHEHFDLVNRCMENHISAVLSSKRMAPTYFGRFQNGRLEEFFENVRPLTHLEMKNPVFCKEIARKLGKFHNISCKDLDWDNGGSGGGSRSCCDGNGAIWARIDEWLQVAKEWYNCSKNKYKDEIKHPNDNNIIIINNNNNNNLILSEISKEWTWLKGQLMEVGSAATRSDRHHDDNENVQNIAKNYCRELVFAHMDCQSLNILTRRQSQTSTVNHDSVSGSGGATSSDFGNNNQDTDDNNNNNNNNNNDSREKINGDDVHLQFIDFEYAGINPRAADIGNTFCEFCDMNNLVPDYAKEYPSDIVQNMFIMSYIRANNDALATKVLNDMSQQDRELFLYTMRQEIGKYSLISHLGWAVWSLIQNKQSSIEFDYIRYAEIRMDGYHMFKNIFW